MTGRALLLPGRAYPVEMPLLLFTGAALEQHGWAVRRVAWSLPDEVPADLDAWVADRAAEAVGDDEGPWLFAAKSLGTRIVLSTARAQAYVLLTPLLHEPDQVAAITRLVADGVPALLVGGTADFSWSAEAARSTGAQLCEVAGADHGMFVPGDPVATAEAHVAVTRAVDRFLTTLR
jgi:hypothetical protein